MFVQIAGLSRKTKVLLMLCCDILLLPLALYSAIALRVGTFQFDISPFYWVFIVLPLFTVPIFIRIGLYRAVIRYMDDRIITTVFYGVSLSVLVLMAVVVMLKVTGIPRSSIVIYWITAIAYISSSRFMARGILRSLEGTQDRRQPVAIYGAGRSGLQTALALMSGPEFKPVAFFDDNADLQGTNVANIRVFSPSEALEIMTLKGCRQLLIAIPSTTRSRRREIIQKFEGKDILLKTLPGMGELLGGKVRIEDIREVGVEDLLGRDAVPPYTDLLGGCIQAKGVLVTGAGGSIGSELCRQICQSNPEFLVLYEQNEFSLYKIERELRRNFPDVKVIAILGDVLDSSQLSQVFSVHRINTVYHAAAFKHVPLVECNIAAGLRNNVFGTLNVAEVSLKNEVENFVLISTDKAVRPTNVMGASKRIAELVLQSMAQLENIKTIFTMVRFGNVLGSSGSVVPLFKEQIRTGGPLTITHPDITRYFMTIPEAAQLVIQAGSLGVGGDVFVLDMGESVKILDLAKKMIKLSGLEVIDPSTGSGDIAIEYVGLRPGEKLYEELLIGENVERTRHPRIMRAVESMIAYSVLREKLAVMGEASQCGDTNTLRTLIKELVPEYVTKEI